jgi:hypothetical protein
VSEHGLDLPAIRELFFRNAKTDVELELRICLLFAVKDIKNITEKELREFRKTHEKMARKSKE